MKKIVAWNQSSLMGLLQRVISVCCRIGLLAVTLSVDLQIVCCTPLSPSESMWHLRRNIRRNLMKGKIFFVEEKKNGTLTVMDSSSIVTAVTQKCCAPLSPSDSTWHLRRSMCGGNNRRPTWKSQKKVQDQENIKYKKEPWKNCLCPSMTGKFHDTSSQWLGPWLWHFAHRIFPSSVVIPEYYSWVIILTNPSEQMKTSAHHFWPPSSLRASSGGSIRRVLITQTLMCILITNFQSASISNAVNINISWFEKF